MLDLEVVDRAASAPIDGPRAVFEGDGIGGWHEGSVWWATVAGDLLLQPPLIGDLTITRVRRNVPVRIRAVGPEARYPEAHGGI